MDSGQSPISSFDSVTSPEPKRKKANPQDASLRYKGLPHYRKLTTIYSPTTVTGRVARASTHRRVPHKNAYASPNLTPSTSASQCSRRKKTPEPAVVSAMQSFMRANDVIVVQVDQHTITSIEMCIEKLNDILDLPESLYYEACTKLLDNQTRRRMFLAMPRSRRRGYIEMLCRL